MTMSVTNKNFVVKHWLILFSFLFLSSCVTTKEDVLYLNNQIVALNAKVNKMDEKISGDLDAIHESQAESVAEADKIKGEIQDVSGRVADNRELVRRAVERDTTEQDAMKATVHDLSRRVAELETKVTQIYEYLGLEGTSGVPQQGALKPPLAAKEPAKQLPVTEKKDVLSDKAFYDKTLTTYKEGKYEEAVTGFKSFIKKHPKSDLTDNAQFWIGESHMALKQYEQAILAYQGVIKKYPKGNKVPNAMLRQALAFYEIKDKKSSIILLKRIIKKYPGSNEAKIAKAKLKTIK
jgi:tol-pal system protein YbgF